MSTFHITLNSSSCEKSCLQFSIPTWSGLGGGGGGGVFHIVLRVCESSMGAREIKNLVIHKFFATICLLDKSENVVLQNFQIEDDVLGFYSKDPP